MWRLPNSKRQFFAPSVISATVDIVNVLLENLPLGDLEVNALYDEGTVNENIKLLNHLVRAFSFTYRFRLTRAN